MKKAIYMLAIILGLSLTTNATSYAQETMGDKIAKSAVYLDLLGSGGTYSINYDIRFQEQGGFGLRAGISYMSVSGVGMFTAPVLANYLFGNGNSYFEVGLGATYMNLSATGNEGALFVDESGIVGTANIGYRYQQTDGGFVFRAGLAPFIGKFGIMPYWPYLSVGYSF